MQPIAIVGYLRVFSTHLDGLSRARLTADKTILLGASEPSPTASAPPSFSQANNLASSSARSMWRVFSMCVFHRDCCGLRGKVMLIASR